MIKNCIPYCEIKISNNGHDADQRDYKCSYKKITQLGYVAEVTVHDGIMELCEILPYMSEENILKMKNV